MEEFLGVREDLMQQRLLIALIGFVIVFNVLSPLMGNILHRLIRPLLPADDRLAVMATGFIIFLSSFAIVMGVLLRFGPAAEIGLPATLLVSVLSGLLVTGMTTLLLWRTMKQLTKHIEPQDEAFRVWDEDVRERRKNLRRR